MKMKQSLIYGFCVFWIAVCFLSGSAVAQSLFKGRRIYLNMPEKKSFRVGITGTTAGYNFIALIEDTQQETISLGALGFWEMVPDPPAYLRNYDLQFVIENHARGNFEIEFEYDEKLQDIRYRVKSGAVLLKLDASEYYPVLIVDSTESIVEKAAVDPAAKEVKRMILFDFNSFDVDLREYYGRIKQMLKNPALSHNFYYYESAGYNNYYFKIYSEVEKLDIEKMGLSTENGRIGYYQRVLENLKSRLGTDFVDQAIIVTRFGKKFSFELKKYASEIGLSRNMEITFWSYGEIE